MAEEELADVQRRFAEVSDRIRRGGVPTVMPGDDPAQLAEKSALRLEQIEAALRPSGPLWSRGGTTAGLKADYAEADTYRIPFAAKSITLLLLDRYGAIVELASSEYPEWSLDALQLQGPLALSLPVTTQSVRIRARNATVHQAAYTLIATTTIEPIGVALLNDTAADDDVDATAASTATAAVLLASILNAVSPLRALAEAQWIASARIALGMELLIDAHLGTDDAISDARGA